MDNPDILFIILGFLKQEKHISLHTCLLVSKTFREIAQYLEPYYNPLGAWLRAWRTPPRKAPKEEIARLKAKHGILGELDSFLWYCYYGFLPGVKMILETYSDEEIEECIRMRIPMPEVAYMNSVRSRRGETNLWTLFEILSYSKHDSYPCFLEVWKWYKGSLYGMLDGKTPYTSYDMRIPSSWLYNWGLTYVVTYARLDMFHFLIEEGIKFGMPRYAFEERSSFFDEGRDYRLFEICNTRPQYAVYSISDFLIFALTGFNGIYTQSRNIATLIWATGVRIDLDYYITCLLMSDFASCGEEEILDDINFVIGLGLNLKPFSRDQKMCMKRFIRKIRDMEWTKLDELLTGNDQSLDDASGIVS